MDHKDNIAKTGLSIMGVFSSAEGPSFGYTIGLTETYGAPELIMFGLPINLYAILLNQLADKLKAGERFKDCAVIHDIANMPCIIKDISLNEARKYAFQTLYHYEGTEHQPRFQMVVLPDKNGTFPWQEGYDVEHMGKCQPDLWKSAGRWKVETLIGNDWENVWSTGRTRKRTDSRGHKYTEHERQKFEGWYEAKAELDDHFKSMDEAGMDYDPSENRIVPVVPQ